MGVLALLPVLILTAIFGGIFGVVAVATRGHEAMTVVGISLAAILMVIVVCTALLGVFGIIAGLGVLYGARWADYLAMVLGALHVFNVPFGTALAVYTIWALSSHPEHQRDFFSGRGNRRTFDPGTSSLAHAGAFPGRRLHR
jgi:hypothetical protein